MINIIEIPTGNIIKIKKCLIQYLIDNNLIFFVKIYFGKKINEYMFWNDNLNKIKKYINNKKC
jgi:hypothetical protein